MIFWSEIAYSILLFLGDFVYEEIIILGNVFILKNYIEESVYDYMSLHFVSASGASYLGSVSLRRSSIQDWHKFESLCEIMNEF